MALKTAVKNRRANRKAYVIMALALVLILCAAVFAACGSSDQVQRTKEARYLNFIDDEPDTMDPQCTSAYYTVPLNIYDRLVEENVKGEKTKIVPSLAESWEVSDDGLKYTFYLHDDVKFSNGEDLTSDDVEYTFKRLLTNKNSVNYDLALNIKGARDLREGRAKSLEGFKVLNKHKFTITLEYPYSAFLACLATPGASILDEKTTKAAGKEFGTDIKKTIGTGPFVLEKWKKEEHMLLKANENCWSGAPKCAGLKMTFDTGESSHRDRFDEGKLDILDLDLLDEDAEYFARGDVYLKNIIRSQRVGISYIALNESVKPLDDVNVRKALQRALDRKTLLKAVVNGRGRKEEGMFPYGLRGYNSKLKDIPYDLEEARSLLARAGYSGGFDLEIDCIENASESQKDLLELVQYMWSKIGVNAKIRMLDEDKFYELREKGKLVCYTGTWSADYNDPDNFIYTFFGNEENTTQRSLCYPDKDVMKRVNHAQRIVDENERIKEYRALEKKIIQEDAAWIPLYSKQHLFVVSDRVKGFTVLWNGWSSNSYRGVTVLDSQ